MFSFRNLIILCISLSGLYVQAQTTSFEDNLYSEFVENLNMEIYNNTMGTRNFIYKADAPQSSNKCSGSFIAPGSKLGVEAINILDQLTNHSENYPSLLNNNALSEYCPKYANATPRQKAYVWALVVTAVTHYEKICKSGNSANGIEILGKLESQMKNNGGKLFSDKSNWDVLRPNGIAEKSVKAATSIKNVIRVSTICK